MGRPQNVERRHIQISAVPIRLGLEIAVEVDAELVPSGDEVREVELLADQNGRGAQWCSHDRSF
jgi:hypothetical protein